MRSRKTSKGFYKSIWLNAWSSLTNGSMMNTKKNWLFLIWLSMKIFSSLTSKVWSRRTKSIYQRQLKILWSILIREMKPPDINAIWNCTQNYSASLKLIMCMNTSRKIFIQSTCVSKSASNIMPIWLWQSFTEETVTSWSLSITIWWFWRNQWIFLLWWRICITFRNSKTSLMHFMKS